MQEHTPFETLAKLIRQKQIEAGNTPCFATEESYQCAIKQCCWHHECFNEAIDTHVPSDFACIT